MTKTCCEWAARERCREDGNVERKEEDRASMLLPFYSGEESQRSFGEQIS